MKKMLSIVLTVALLATMLVAPVSAAETVELDIFTVGGVTEIQKPDSGAYDVYYGEGSVEITLTTDLPWINFYYINDNYANYIDVNFNTPVDTGSAVFEYSNVVYKNVFTNDTKSYDELEIAYFNGEVDIDDWAMAAGSTFSMLFEGLYCFDVFDEYGGTYGYYYFRVLDVDDADSGEETETEEAEEAETVSEETVEETTVVASGNMVNVTVDGKTMELAAYNIADNNYFKLRDIAALVSGSDKQFEVTWNNDEEMIEMTSGLEYTLVGDENEATEISDAEALASTAGLLKDGEAATATAYTIADNNYFKLRDLCQMFDFNVTWDDDTESIIIDTASAYTAD